MGVPYIIIVPVLSSNTVSVSSSDVLGTAPTTPTSLAPVLTPASHSGPSSSCEPQNRCTSSARSSYAKPLTTTPAAAVAAPDVWPETWGQSMTAKLWSWVPSDSKVCSRLYLILISTVGQMKNYIRLAVREVIVISRYYENKRLFTISLCQALRKRKKRLKRRKRLNLILQWATSIIFTNQYNSHWDTELYSPFFSSSHYLIKRIIWGQSVFVYFIKS